VIFHDHTEIILSSEERVVTYTNKDKTKSTHKLDQVTHYTITITTVTTTITITTVTTTITITITITITVTITITITIKITIPGVR
jgi:hypothetical protein